MIDGSESFCGTIAFGIAFDDDMINSATTILAYEDRALELYSEDFTLVGMHNV
jgi:hypothetical protein